MTTENRIKYLAEYKERTKNYPKCLGRKKASNHGAPKIWRNPCAIKTNKKCPHCNKPVCGVCQRDQKRHKC